MNSLLIALICLVLFGLGYIFYGRLLERLYSINEEAETPAHRKFDGVDYVPARNWVVLFGHHFSSIAGAAPVIGPIVALSIWGWGPALLWIVLGSVFMGGVHDFGALAISVRKGGNSIANITEEVISRKARLFFATFVWLTLILVIAVFVYLCAKTLAFEPRIVIPSAGLVFVALVVGLLFYKTRLNQGLVTFLGLAGIVGLVFLGHKVPLEINAAQPQIVWGYILLAYAFVASITPVNILLQPRDYLSAFLLIFGVTFGYLGILFYHPQMNMPFFSGFKWSDNALWPMLCVTIACGAISGFHSLIASGTTSKQISSEAHSKRIGYGAMLAEAIVAVLALLVVGAGLANKEALMVILAEGGAGPIGAFGEGYGALTGAILGGFGGFLAIVVLNAFILTTLDTATRIGRYLTQELFGIKNRYLATLIVVVLSGWLGLSGNWSKIWPIFGAANQLVAALTLLVITAWLLSRQANIYFTAIPCLIMLFTTVAALAYKIPKYLGTGDFLLGIISIALLIVAFYMLVEAFGRLSGKKT